MIRFLLLAGIKETDERYQGLMIGGAIGCALGGVILLRWLPELIAIAEQICRLTGAGEF